jgi:hypothetical protein
VPGLALLLVQIPLIAFVLVQQATWGGPDSERASDVDVDPNGRQLLGMEREGFIRYASQQGIPYFQLQGEELQREIDASKKL